MKKIAPIFWFVIATLSCSGPATGPEQFVEIEVKPGMTAYQVGEALRKKGVLQSLFWFKLAAKLRGASRIHKGFYFFSNRASSTAILHKLVKGDVVNYHFTVKEGFSNRQIQDLFTRGVRLVDGANEGASAVPRKYERTAPVMTAEQFSQTARSPALLKKYQLTAPTCEGYLFPSTYFIPKGSSPEAVFSVMLDQFFKVYHNDSFKNAAGAPPLKNFHEVLILASLVEKEARAEDERPKVASVFLNRLKIGKKLQSCATIQYILGHPKRLYEKDLKISSPYNTYLHKGLPPGPICNPGKAAVAAALFPAKTDYLYFVRDQSSPAGRHFFNATYQDHLLDKNSY